MNVQVRRHAEVFGGRLRTVRISLAGKGSGVRVP
jgi:hypothetical protein